jgi:hypothetical protein
MGIKHFLILFILLPLFSFSQNDTIKFWIQFTDKANTPYSINAPSEFLSERAIERRKKQNIPIIEQDLPVNTTYIDSVLNSGLFYLQNSSKWFNAITISTNDSANINALNTISFINSIKNVQYAPIYYDENFTAIQPTTKQAIASSYNIPNYPYGKTFNQINLHKVQRLHELGFNGQGMHIAVIDAGFLNVNTMPGLGHLFSENRILSTRDFVAREASVYEDHYHGAAVLSIIAGNIPGEYYGTAPKASFHLLRSEDAGSELIVEEDNWVAAAEYADSAGVDLINTSLGYLNFDDSTQNHTYADLDGNTTRIAIASDIAASKGILLVTSAGNSGQSSWKYISTPADADSVLTIAAVNENGERGAFSSVGPSSDGDIKPNIASVGWDTYFISPGSGNIERGSGTSFSAPMTTGMAACLWQGLPQYTNMEIKQLIEESSDQFNSPDSLNGYGIPNFYKAYHKATGVNYTSPNNSIEKVHPNPFVKRIELNILSNEKQTVEINIKNYLGQPIKTLEQEIELGRNILNINFLENWKAGIYFVSLEFKNGDVETVKVVKA